MLADEKDTIKKFVDTLGEDEKNLLSTYLSVKTYESLSDKFDELLKELHED